MVSILVTFVLFAGALAQQPQPGTFTLGGVQVAGASRYTEPQVVRLSGLESGRPVTVSELDNAAQRLVDTGLFHRVSYKYRTAAGQLTVTFEIEEPKWTVPVILDNFVWFTDKELDDWLRAAVPSFDGTAPDSDRAPEFLTGALQGLLEDRRIPGRVHFTLQTNLRTKALMFVFSVRDPTPKVCALAVEGASALPEEQLVAALRRDMPLEYSRSFLQSASTGTLTDMYRHRGYWRAAFGSPKATLDGVPGCSGVAVTLSVDEGPSYTWERAEWKGNAAATPAQLDALFGMKSGDTPALARIEEGVRRVHQAYEKQGFILQSATYAPRLDDATRRAIFEMTVDEGPQFLMGVVEFEGFPENVAGQLQAKWRIKPGEVFDGSYPVKFLSEEIKARLRGVSPGVELRADRDRQVAHVKFVVK